MVVFEKIFHRRNDDSLDADADDWLQDVEDGIDPVIARDYDAALVERGLLSVDAFNKHYVNAPYLNSEQMEERKRLGLPDPLETYLLEHEGNPSRTDRPDDIMGAD